MRKNCLHVIYHNFHLKTTGTIDISTGSNENKELENRKSLLSLLTNVAKLGSREAELLRGFRRKSGIEFQFISPPFCGASTSWATLPVGDSIKQMSSSGFKTDARRLH